MYVIRLHSSQNCLNARDEAENRTLHKPFDAQKINKFFEHTIIDDFCRNFDSMLLCERR